VIQLQICFLKFVGWT